MKGTAISGIVLDSSVAIAWALEDEQEDLANRAVELAFKSIAHLPALWFYEVQNVLAVATRRGRLTLDDAREVCDTLSTIPSRVHSPQSLGKELAISMPSGLTAYDAAYLCLARDLQVPLATLDERLVGSARSLGIPVFNL